MIYFNVISIISFIISFVFLSIGLYIFLSNIKNKVHILFFCQTFACFILGFFFSFLYSLKDINLLKNIYKIVGIGFFLCLPFALHTYSELTGYLKKNIFIITIIYLIGIAFVIKNFFSPVYFKEFITEDYINYFIIDYKGIWSILFTIYMFGCILCFTIFLILWYIKTDKKRIKKQSSFIFINLIIILAFLLLDLHILPIFTKYKSIGIIGIIGGLYIISISYAIMKYRMLNLTPEQISNDIISNIEESVILLDLDNKIISVNKKTEELVNNTNLKDSNLSSVIFEFDKINENIDKIKNNSFNDFSCRVHLINCKDEMPLMDAKFSIINDKFGDKLGILIIAHEVKELKKLKAFYKITDKEAEVIQHIVNGTTNKEIADKIVTSERTVKAHISNIYDKFGVDNRAQLLGILKDFNLLPQHNAEKIVIL